MLEPITLEIAMSADPLSAELLINNSGADVANETTVKPITTLDKFSLIDRSTADFKDSYFQLLITIIRKSIKIIELSFYFAKIVHVLYIALDDK